MKRNLLLSLALLAIGFGVNQVFLQGEEKEDRFQISQPPIVQTPITQIPITQVPIVQLKLTQPQSTQLPVTQIPDTQTEGDSFYHLLHPDRKNRQDNLKTEDAKKGETVFDVSTQTEGDSFYDLLHPDRKNR